MTNQAVSVESTSTVSVGFQLEADLRIAERVHRSMIPKNEHRGPLAVACDFRPMIGVGGDYATVHFQDARYVVVGVCDIAGHGIGSALLAARVNSFVLGQAPTLRHPCELVESLNCQRRAKTAHLWRLKIAHLQTQVTSLRPSSSPSVRAVSMWRGRCVSAG